MFANYILVGIRSALRQRLFFLINLLGFAIGLAACFLVLIHVLDELSYDDWIADSERVYRLESTTNVPGRAPKPVANSMGIARDFLAAELEGVEAVARMFPNAAVIRIGDKAFAEIVMEVDANFMTVVPLELLYGDPETALAGPGSMILSASQAVRFFGRVDAVSEAIEYQNPVTEQTETYRITGIMRDLPEQTHFDFDVLAHFDVGKYGEARYIAGSWFLRNVYTYLKLAKGTDVATLRQALSQFVDRHIDTSRAASLAGLTPNEFLQLELVALGDIHLTSSGQGQMKAVGSMGRVYAFSGIAALILLIACINFINLTTAKANLRAREVSIRKVLGAARRQVAIQFMAEALLLSSLAFLLALGVVELLLPWLGEMLGKTLEFGAQITPTLISGFAAIAIAAGALAGAYPAFVLSAFRPARILHSDRPWSAARGHLRNALVIIQFAIAIVLIVASAVIARQVAFANSVDLGFAHENLLVVRNANLARDVLLSEIIMDPDVVKITFAGNAPTDEDESQRTIRTPGPEGEISRQISALVVDANFFAAMEVALLAGREFSAARGLDLFEPRQLEQTAGIIVNQAALGLLGFADAKSALGRSARLGNGKQLEIIGVVDDFYYRSVRTEVRPTMYVYAPPGLEEALVEYRPGVDESALLARLEAVWNEATGGAPFTAEFVGDLIAAKYTSENQQRRLLMAGAVLAVVISALGIFGLVLFTIERRFKEIAIRKVLGARTRDIVRLMVWQFSRPVVLANLIAWPIAWFLMRDWLDGFARRIVLGADSFVLAAAISLTVALAVVASNSLKVARAKPIEALRYE